MGEMPIMYRGHRTTDGAVVDRSDGVYIKECNNLANHSNGLEWGYAGSGPAQCALALLMDTLEDRRDLRVLKNEPSDVWKETGITAWAMNHYMKFKWDVVSLLDRTGWVMSQEYIYEWIKRTEKEERQQRRVESGLPKEQNLQ